jgi:hypothetical protein
MSPSATLPKVNPKAISMNNLHVKPSLLGACLALLLAASTSHAQVYKWVDANGQTHYSEKKEAAANSSADQMKLSSSPISAEEAKASAEYWQERNKALDQRHAKEQQAKTYAPPAARPRSLSGGRSDGSDASRCALARDVLSGAVRHRNGAPIDKNDRETAENDVRAACR